MVEDREKYIEALYDRLLVSDSKYLDSLRDDAKRAGKGVDTGIKLHSKDAKGNLHDFPLVFPKYAVSLVCVVEGAYDRMDACFVARDEYIPHMPKSGTQGVCVRIGDED